MSVPSKAATRAGRLLERLTPEARAEVVRALARLFAERLAEENRLHSLRGDESASRLDAKRLCR